MHVLCGIRPSADAADCLDDTGGRMTQLSNDMSNEQWLVGVFDDRHEAETAVDELEQAGFKHDQLGFAIRGSDAVSGGMITDAEGTKDGIGAATGLAAGAITGGI